MTTTSWLLDRALADQTRPFDTRPFRALQLGYAILCACVLILLYHPLGLPWILAVVEAFIEEAAAFPNGRNDDQVDEQFPWSSWQQQASRSASTARRAREGRTGAVARMSWTGAQRPGKNYQALDSAECNPFKYSY